MRSVLAIALLAAPIAGWAVEKQRVEVTGRIAAGPCAGADLFIADSGATYELDRSRVRLKVGDEVRISGAVYPRISVCKKHPWFDVERVTGAQPAKATQAIAPIERRSTPVADLPANGVVLTVPPDHLLTLVPMLAALRERPDISTIRLQVQETGDTAQLTATLLRIGTEAPQLMEKVDLRLGTYASSDFLRVSGGRVVRYSNLEEFKHALALR